MLDAAAETGVSKCNFKAGTVDGKPTEMWMSMTYIWALGDDDAPDLLLSKTMLAAKEGNLDALYALPFLDTRSAPETGLF